MECWYCSRGPGDGVILLRQNAKDEAPRWACVTHNLVKQDPAVMSTVAVLSEVLAA